MAVVGHSGTPLDVSFEEHPCRRRDPDWIPVDTRLTPTHDNVVRLMTHLHGGFVAAASDGNPAVTPDGFVNGETQHVHYTNQQPQMPAEMLWFHDHGLGATRLNVFAGLAAGYIPLRRFRHRRAPNPNGLPSGPFEIPLVVQDRQFNADGTFLYPTSDISGEEGRKLAKLLGEKRRRVRDRPPGRWASGCVRSRARSVGVPAWTQGEVVALAEQPASCWSARPRRRAGSRRSPGATRSGVARTRHARPLASSRSWGPRREKVAGQIRQWVKGEPITDRIMSVADPDARPIR